MTSLLTSTIIQKRIVVFVMAITMLFGMCTFTPKTEAAQTDLAAMQAQIQQLLAIVQSLQVQLAAMQATSANNGWRIAVGSQVQTTDQLKVRGSAGMSGNLIGTKSPNTNGSVLYGPRYANGYTWWYVEFDDNAVDGWVAANWLQSLSSSPLQSAESSLTSTVTPQPTCRITTDQSSYTLGEDIKVKWSSNDANYAAFLTDTSGKDTINVPGDKLSTNGSTYLTANVTGRPTVTLKVIGDNNRTTSCQTQFEVIANNDQDDKTVSIEAPTCELSTDKPVYEYMDKIKVSWTSANANYVQFVPDTSGKDTLFVTNEKAATPGSLYLDATVYGNPTLTLKAVAGDSSAICSTMFTIEEKLRSFKAVLNGDIVVNVPEQNKYEAEELCSQIYNDYDTYNFGRNDVLQCYWDGQVFYTQAEWKG